jgi:hypothetical protein
MITAGRVDNVTLPNSNVTEFGAGTSNRTHHIPFDVQAD